MIRNPGDPKYLRDPENVGVGKDSLLIRTKRGIRKETKSPKIASAIGFLHSLLKEASINTFSELTVDGKYYYMPDLTEGNRNFVLSRPDLQYSKDGEKLMRAIIGAKIIDKRKVTNFFNNLVLDYKRSLKARIPLMSLSLMFVIGPDRLETVIGDLDDILVDFDNISANNSALLHTIHKRYIDELVLMLFPAWREEAEIAKRQMRGLRQASFTA